MKKQRVWTPELKRRRVSFRHASGPRDRPGGSGYKMSGLAESTFSKALWGEYPADQNSKTLKIVEKAIAQGLRRPIKRCQVRKPASRNFNC